MSDPEGISSDDKGNIYIASYGNGKILKFTSDGDFVTSWNVASEDGKTTLIHPHGIFIEEERVYITELAGDISVIVYDLDGNFIDKFGNGSERWRLRYPTSLWVYKDIVLVADALANQVKLFSTEGKYIRSIGELGIGEGQLYYPYGVGVDKSGTVYIGDTHNHRIQFFTFDGVFKGVISNPSESGNNLTIDYQKNLNELEANFEIFEIGSGVDIEVLEKNIYILDPIDGAIKKYHEGTVTDVLTGLNFPWSISKESNDLFINDDPGSLTMYTLNPFVFKLYMNMTSLQFDPIESLNAWIYRAQDAIVKEDEIIIANTVPGNVVVIDRYGGIKESISWNSSTDNNIFRTMPTSVDIVNEGQSLIVADMTGKVLYIDRIGKEAKQFKSPIEFYQPYRVKVIHSKNMIAVTEPYANRIQFFDLETFEWIGLISNSTIPEISHPAGITSDDQGNIYISSLNSQKVIKLSLYDQINKPKETNNPESIPVVIEQSNPLLEKSPYKNIYGNDLSKALNYWSYYKNDLGIAKYDFGFSWLNFKVPVDPGYGNHVWNTGVAHYALINYYKWKETKKELYKDTFLLHIDWMVKNAIKEKNGLVVWPNEVEVNIPNINKRYISSSAQSGIAASLIHAMEVDPKNKDKYRELAIGALKAFDTSVSNGGVVIWLNGNKYFVEYPSLKEETQRYDIIPSMWTLILLKEAGSIGETYYNEGLKLLEDLKISKTLINGHPYWGEQLWDKSIDLQTSKIVMKALNALDIKID